jgi:hypothetical protein
LALAVVKPGWPKTPVAGVSVNGVVDELELPPQAASKETAGMTSSEIHRVRRIMRQLSGTLQGTAW